jgi:hypothetical protein
MENEPDMNWPRISAGAQILLTAYFAFIVCVPLGAWNRQPGHEAMLVSLWHGKLDVASLIFVGIFVTPGIVYLVAYRKGNQTWMWFMLIFDAVWLGLQIKSWWVPYLFGAAPEWQLTYERTFSQSYKFLPTYGSHLPPDAMHAVLQLLLVAATLTGLIAAAKGFRAEEPRVTLGKGN